MKTKNIIVNGTPLDIIMKHYNSISILIDHAAQTKGCGGKEALDKWDNARTFDMTPAIKIEIKNY